MLVQRQGHRRASVSRPGRPATVNLTLLHTSDIHSRLFPYEQVITQVDAHARPRRAQHRREHRRRRAHVVHPQPRARALGPRPPPRLGRLLPGRAHLQLLRRRARDPRDERARRRRGRHRQPRVRPRRAERRDASSSAGRTSRSSRRTTSSTDRRRTSRTSARRHGRAARSPSSTRAGSRSRVIGMANLSSFTSIFDQPNRLGITPLNTIEVAQFYIDLLRPYVDLVVMVTHLGLEVDQRMIRGTTGIDVILGGHNHVVINPPQEIRDCSADPNNPGFVWAVDPNAQIDPTRRRRRPGPTGPAGSRSRRTTRSRSSARARRARSSSRTPARSRSTSAASTSSCRTTRALVVARRRPEPTTTRSTASRSCRAATSAFPIDATVPEDPVLVDMLQPYRRSLDLAADLDILVGYSPAGLAALRDHAAVTRRSATSSATRSGSASASRPTSRSRTRPASAPTSTRARSRSSRCTTSSRSTTRSRRCSSPASRCRSSSTSRRAARAGPRLRLADPDRRRARPVQLHGLRPRQHRVHVRRRVHGAPRRRATSATSRRTSASSAATTDDDCATRIGGTCDPSKKVVRRQRVRRAGLHRHTGHASAATTRAATRRATTAPAAAGHLRQDAAARPTGSASRSSARPNLYELATSNYLAGGGSGFRVLQRNTTQFDTKIQQRDALIDYLRSGKPCGYDPAANETPDGLKACAMDDDCGDPTLVCSCPGHVGPERQWRGHHLRVGRARARTAAVAASARTAAIRSRSSTSSAARVRPTRRPARCPSRRVSSPARSARSSRASTRRSAASPTTAWS